MIRIRHGRVSIALHELRDAPGPALLCLHAVGGSGEDFREAASAWPGRVFALDFPGHGRSDPLRGGAYHPELLAADADAALARIGPAHLAGVGSGAYAALLLAGGRPGLVAAALLLPGAGLAGGGPAPDFAGDTHARWADLAPPLPGCDPAARRLERDVRPADYAQEFARAARRLLLAEDGAPRPPWWEAARASPSAEPAPPELSRALVRLGA
jgi:pimeloyl-ACP methyl ester carboxylesterase